MEIKQRMRKISEFNFGSFRCHESYPGVSNLVRKETNFTIQNIVDSYIKIYRKRMFSYILIHLGLDEDMIG